MKYSIQQRVKLNGLLSILVKLNNRYRVQPGGYFIAHTENSYTHYREARGNLHVHQLWYRSFIGKHKEKGNLSQIIFLNCYISNTVF